MKGFGVSRFGGDEPMPMPGRSKMRKALIISVYVIAINMLVFIAAPMTANAIGGGDALAGLGEFYSFLLGLGDIGLEGYVEFLQAVP